VNVSSATEFICGSNGFVESAARALLDNGVEPDRIRTERFGPTGRVRDGSKDLFVHQSAATVGAV